MTLTVTTEPLENRQLSMTIEVDEARIDQEMRKAARTVSQKVRIPGFRKGRVPFHVLLQFVGREAIIGEFVDELGSEVYKEALEQEGLEPYFVGNLEKVDTEEEVRFHLTVPLPPEVRLGDYRSLRIEEEEVEADEEDVQERIGAILEQNADFVEAHRPSRYGDLMTVDFRGVVLDDNGNETEIAVFDEEDWDVTPDQENPMEPAGLDEALIGLSTGDEKSFEIAWPKDSPSMYAGNTVRFAVQVHKVRSYETPEHLTDEIAQNFGPDFDSASELLDSIRGDALEAAGQRAEADYLLSALESLVDMSEIAYPPVAVDMQIERIMRESDARARQMGLRGLEQFLEFSNQTVDAYRESLRGDAEQTLARDLALQELAKSESLQVSDEEFEQHIERAAGPLPDEADEETRKARGDMLDMMRGEHTRPMVQDDILKDKSIQLLLAIARGQEIPEAANGDVGRAEAHGPDQGEQEPVAQREQENGAEEDAPSEEPPASGADANETQTEK